jgi:enoyl-[acyl-carrier-protein] reductase (NADH)
MLGSEAVFLAWDAGGFLTGQTTYVDGGFSVTLRRRFGDGLIRH